MSRFILAVVTTGAFALNGIAAPAQNQAALQHIDRASELLFTASSPDAQKGIASLLDAVAELTAVTNTPASVSTSVQAARQELRSDRPPLDDKIGRLLRDAYQTLNAGKPFQQTAPEDLSEFSAQLKRRLDSARNSVVAGKADESVRTILGVALAIITPMHP